MPINKKSLIAMTAQVEITASEAEGEKKGPPKFTATFYTGGALEIDGWDAPVVVDLAGLEQGKVLVANLDHDRTKRVGNFAVANDGKSLVANGTASARTPAREEVIGSAEDGYLWQASLEVKPHEVEEIQDGELVMVNGQEFSGPLYVTRKGTLKGFAFVSHGADDNTTVAIAAKAASHKDKKMLKAEVKEWIESLGLVAEDLTKEQVANFTADFEGREGSRPIKGASPSDGVEKRSIEAKRRKQIMQMAEMACDKALDEERYEDVDVIREARDSAIKNKISASDFRYELMLATLTSTPPAVHTAQSSVNGAVLEAAICQHGQLAGYEKQFDDQTLQVAHDKFKGRISLQEVVLVAAESNGYKGIGRRVDTDTHNAAFGMGGAHNQIRGAGFSTISLPTTFSNVANKFSREGFMSVDQTALRLANVRPTNDYKQITTVSLTGAMQFLPVGADGELKHGALGEQTYSNQVAPAGILYAITDVDYRNDDLGVLTATPRRMGRGGMLYLNHIFWTEFLNPSVANFFHSSHANVNTGVADVSIAGLTATEIIFRNLVDPDGKPLGTEPAVMLVPTGGRAAALTLMDSQNLIDGTATATQGNGNIWRGRFRVESSPYMSNSAYTGYDAAAWYLLADKSDMPVIEIAALDGNVQPMVETAAAAFNTLGVQMRGHFAIGVKMQEPLGGVRADGGTS